MDEKITIDLEKIKETFELKEGCKYIISCENTTEAEMFGLIQTLKHRYNIDVTVINTSIKVYEIKNG